MGRHDPPVDYDGHPHALLLPAGSVLWRVHSRHRPAEAFKPYRREYALGRFDGGDDDPYGTLYLASDEVTAVAEVLMRGLPYGRTGHRFVPYDAVRGRRLSAVRVTAELRLIDLVRGAALGAVCQDDWLIYCAESEFDKTRRWASWLRAQDGLAAGMMWTTRRNLVNRSVVLFADRGAALEPASLPAVDLDSGPGLDWLNEHLRQFRTSVNRPGPAW
ncbi:hypothetical protein Skr01_15440 [Sphaerisporangium krabiense]|uniref:RES domain-containing protein n=1 Tax=Sphaerisporangium krabiense TaxID=763782 RepID=A0A7W8YZJ5_9ACTN|nr:RES family NAD+ phosphorylase [Sphaerisporangium krabiense]MBB5624587.1 hypothetical protein [Sphaerisporangium krabiense]GII61459.1 hypothetical protein Skr01_15440 [Sphaerisporangium krabiense]